jgi:DNA-binding XRE family transcriptional regulator
MHFGAKLRMVRVWRRVTQDQLSAETGLRQPVLSAIEQEQCAPAEDMIAILKAAPSLRWPPRADEAFALLEEE